MQWLSKSRYRGTVLLAAGILFTGSIQFIFSGNRLKAPDEPDRAAEMRLLDSLLSQIQADSALQEVAYRENGAAQELALRPFNPNTVDRADWLDMGLPPKAFESLERYRMKGGIFRNTAQVFKIPNLGRELAQQMEPLLMLPDSSKKGITFRTGEKRKKPSPPTGPFDLNRADSLQLSSVFGIGSKTASRILRYRENLGGFIQKEQLYEVWGLDSLVAEELMDRTFISSQPGIRKINPNTAEEETMAAHPYIRKGLGRLIVRYRRQHPAFSKPEDLLGIRLFRKEQLEQLRPYLRFD